MAAIIGIDIGGTKCAVVEADAAGLLLHEARFATTDVSGTLAAIFAAVAARQPGPDTVFGVSCGGPLDSARGVILSPANLPDWDAVPITRLLTERFGGSAFLMNDANAGALAEWQFGAGQGCRNVIFCTHGTGFGAGVILDGRLYEGATGDAGEIGHVRLAADGPIGYGKAGSVEGFCSGGGIARWAALRHLPYASTREVAEAAECGEPAAIALLHESGQYLGRALAILIDLLNPDVIVLGSLYLRAGRFLELGMRATLAEDALPGPLRACRIVPSALGEQIGNYAAIAIAKYRGGTKTGGSGERETWD